MAKKFKYVAPKGMKRIYTKTGRFGVGRLLANEAGEHFAEIFFFRSSAGGNITKKDKATRLFTPTSRIDAVKMNLSPRKDGKGINEIEAISKAVNGKRAGLALLPQAPATEAPATEAPAAVEAVD